MTQPDERAAIAEALRTDGVVFPRGVLATEGHELARALGAEEPPDDLQELVDAATEAHWPELQPAIEAALVRALEKAEEPRHAALVVAVGLASSPEPDNPLARSIAVRAAQELATARRRALEIVAAAEGPMGAGGPAGMVAGARAAGAAAVELLDLDPDDFDAEITAYVGAVSDEPDEGTDSDALSQLARATGDGELRAAARIVVRSLTNDLSDAANAALAPVLDGAAPEDAAEDAVWVGAALALAEQAIERALVEEALGGGGNGASAEE